MLQFTQLRSFRLQSGTIKKVVFVTLLLFCSVCSNAQFYNGSQVTFGKNRVQYEDRFWSFYKFKNFDTYFYLGGKELAVFTGRTATKDLDEIEKLLDYKLDGRLQFIIYDKLSDAKQSNIGLERIDETQQNIGGVTKIVGNKIFLYFTGDHEKLHQQIRAGIARVLIDEIMYGGNVKERFQNSALLTLPDWYMNGLISYISRRWNVEMDNRVRDGIVSKKYLKFNHLTGIDALYAGHSIWKYIVDTYGETSISNLLYMTRINRNIESGFLFVIGASVKTLSQSWQDYMLNKYAASDVNRTLPTGQPVVRKPKTKLIYNQLRVSPDGRYAAYVINDIGKYKVKLFDISAKKTKRILKGGYRSYVQETDESFPLLAWQPGGKVLAMIRERRGKLWLGFYTPSERKYAETRLFNFEKVREFSYSDDGQLLVFSAMQQGESDIFVYNLRSHTYEQITRDFYDDITPHFVDHDRGIVFSSNRVNDTLEVDRRELLPADNNFDIFYYDYAGRNKLLRRITNTPNVNETQPVPYDSAGICFLSDKNGILNRYVAYMDSTISFVDTVEHYRYYSKIYPQTDYSRNILSQDINFRKQKMGEIIFSNGKYRMYVEDVPAANTSSITPPPNTIYENETLHEAQLKKQPTRVKPESQQEEPAGGEANPPAVIDSGKIDINNYIFQSDFPAKTKTKKQEREAKRKEEAAKTNGDSVSSVSAKADSVAIASALPKQRNYDPAFTSDYIVTQLDNSMLNNTYQLFNGGGIYYNPGLSGFFEFGISDLMEDYKFTGGFNLAGDLNSNGYFLSYENLKRRLDKKLTFYRQVYEISTGLDLEKEYTHELSYENRWPFSDVSRIGGTISYRNDRAVVLASDAPSLSTPNQSTNWAHGEFEYVFDNTLPTGLNLYNGTRLKVFGEIYRQLDQGQATIKVVGFDIRHYIKIHREIIWANRLSASTSWGQDKIIYYLGGVDNWLSPNFNSNTPIDYTQNYVFQSLAAPLRGFDQNIRNGNSFVLLNSELRIPVFTYLLNRPIKSDFIRNFMVIGFADVGTAWNGKSPYDSTNALNNYFITPNPNPFVIELQTQHEPIVSGFGFGLRSRLLGYFIRADWAWGYEDGAFLPSEFYLSLSLDF